MSPEPRIFDYSDYRKFIEAFYTAKNARMKRRYSYRAFAKEAGFASPNYICLIIQGKKNIAEEGIHGLAQAMKLTKRERDFFEALVYFNQATNAEKKEYYFRRVCAFKEFAAGHRLLREQYEYFSKWYNVAIRELVSLPEFRQDTQWIARKLNPPISPKEAKEALDLLYALGLIKREKGGRFVLADPHLCTDDEIHSTMAVNFHREMMQRGIDSLQHEAHDRDLSAITMALDRHQFEEIKRRTAEFRKEVQSYLIENPRVPDRVCQLNFQFFHLTDTTRRES